MIDYTPKKKQEVYQKFARTPAPKKLTVRSPVVDSVYVRETEKIPSLNSGFHETSKPKPKVYTGNVVVGISIIHKSCLQPIFSQQEAVDAASMRR